MRPGRLLRRRRSAGGNGDGALAPDSASWLAAGERRYRKAAYRYTGSPDALGWGGRERYAADDVAAALYFFAASIDALHERYCVDGMLHRLPGPTDDWIVDGFGSALAAVLAAQPTAPVASVVGDVVERLRSIAAACEVVGTPDERYCTALTAIGGLVADDRS